MLDSAALMVRKYIGIFLSLFTLLQTLEANALLKELDDYAFTQKKTKSLIIQHKGKIIYEKYSSDWSPDKPHLLWSMTKSITNQLLAIAISDGRITLEESICTKIKELRGSQYCAIKVSDVINFASGLKWNEVYENSITESSPISQLYGQNHQGMLSFVLNRPHDLLNTPGNLAMYSSGDTLILSELMRRSYSAKEYETLPWKKWADKIGITSLVFEKDKAGTFIGSSYAYLTARDTLKWGNFTLNNGVVNNKQVLPTWWMKFSTQVSSAYLKDRIIRDPDEMMGRHWWVNKKIPQIGFQKAWKYLPEDTYAAVGHWGQTLTIIPSEELIVVRYGDDKDASFKINEFIRYALQFARGKAIPKTKSTTGNPAAVNKHYTPGLNYARDVWFLSKTRAEISLFSRFKAKEFCSCVYVMKQTEKYCKEFVKNKAVPAFLAPLSHNKKNKMVKVNCASARFISEKNGCQLL